MRMRAHPPWTENIRTPDMSKRTRLPKLKLSIASQSQRFARRDCCCSLSLGILGISIVQRLRRTPRRLGRCNSVTSKRLLVCDLDNTLYDWVGYFVPSFYAMVDAAVMIMGCDKEQLLNDFRKIHQSHGDSEHPFALLETDTVKQYFRNASADSAIAALDPAFHAFNSARITNLKLHPYVLETLQSLEASGVKLVAHTESKLYGVVDRLNRL